MSETPGSAGYRARAFRAYSFGVWGLGFRAFKVSGFLGVSQVRFRDLGLMGCGSNNIKPVRALTHEDISLSSQREEAIGMGING